jgi:hypothetical protein
MGAFTALLIFFLNITEALFKAVLRATTRAPKPPATPAPHLPPDQQVAQLEVLRMQRGYKPGWLFYRCQELGLEDTLQELQQDGTLEHIRRQLGA